MQSSLQSYSIHDVSAAALPFLVSVPNIIYCHIFIVPVFSNTRRPVSHSLVSESKSVQDSYCLLQAYSVLFTCPFVHSDLSHAIDCLLLLVHDLL